MNADDFAKAPATSILAQLLEILAERLAEISSPEFPDERLVACYNPQLAEQRRQKRQELLAAAEAELEASLRAWLDARKSPRRRPKSA